MKFGPKLFCVQIPEKFLGPNSRTNEKPGELANSVRSGKGSEQSLVFNWIGCPSFRCLRDTNTIQALNLPAHP